MAAVRTGKSFGIEVNADNLAGELDRDLPQIGFGYFGTCSQDNICFHHQLLCRSLGHSRTEAQGVTCRYDALAGGGGQNGRAQGFSNFLRGPAGIGSAAAEDHERSFRGRQKPASSRDAFRGGLRA